jgi:hypothetical protein
MTKQEKKYWNTLYLFVLVFLLLQILFYYFLSVYFNHN